MEHEPAENNLCTREKIAGTIMNTSIEIMEGRAFPFRENRKQESYFELC